MFFYPSLNIKEGKIYFKVFVQICSEKDLSVDSSSFGYRND